MLTLGGVEIKLLHTPGHTPGSQCFLVSDQLLTGDTLFLQGCGRTDFPGGDARQLYDSLTQVLMKIPDHTTVLPGHNYSGASSSMSEIKHKNYVMKLKSREEFLRMMGAE